MGTPEFAVESLRKIYESGYEIVCVVTAPDKERGRGRKISFTPVKEFAVEKKLKVLQPVSLKEPGFIEELKSLNADLFVVVAFRILPREVYTIPTKGSFNLHASLLPKFRGAAPIHWALITGETETGVTTFFLEDKVDTGNMILQEKIKIDDEDNLGSLYEKLMRLGSETAVKTIRLIESGEAAAVKQDGSLASPAPKITKELCVIDWHKSARDIHNLVRGLSPAPCAFFVHNGKSYKIHKSRIAESGQNIPAGGFFQTKNEIYAGTGNGILEILEIQPEGRKAMTNTEFLRGYSLL